MDAMVACFVLPEDDRHRLQRMPVITGWVPHSSYRGWFKKMDSNSYVYISWTVRGMWMIWLYFYCSQLFLFVENLKNMPLG